MRDWEDVIVAQGHPVYCRLLLSLPWPPVRLQLNQWNLVLYQNESGSEIWIWTQHFASLIRRFMAQLQFPFKNNLSKATKQMWFHTSAFNCADKYCCEYLIRQIVSPCCLTDRNSRLFQLNSRLVNVSYLHIRQYNTSI